MHCEQNLSKNILKTITGEKDTVKVRGDLQWRGIRKHQWLISNPKKPGEMLKPAAQYVLTNEEFDIFASTIESRGGGGDLEIFIRYGVTKDMVCLILMS